MNSTIAYTQHHQIIIPDIQIKEEKAFHRYVATRGYAYTMAVFNLSGSCVGWILSETLGFDNVAQYLMSEKCCRVEVKTIH